VIISIKFLADITPADSLFALQWQTSTKAYNC